MKLYLTEEEMDDASFNMSGANNVLACLDDKNARLLESIVTSTSSMLGKLPTSNTSQHASVAHNNICKLVQSRYPYLFKAHPSIEQLIRSKHTGANLHGVVIKPKRVLMQVSQDTKGTCWFISDRPITIDEQHPITILSKGSGYFEYHGPDAPIGSDYYIDEYKEW